jgi:aminopeptidase N
LYIHRLHMVTTIVKRIIPGGLVSVLLAGLGSVAAAQAFLPQMSVPGVSRSLAWNRALYVQDIRYELHFSVPASRGEPVRGYETIRFRMKNAVSRDDGFLLVDFKGVADGLSELTVNDNGLRENYHDEHLLIPGQALRVGENMIKVSWIAGNGALNRNADFLYTLLVPDRARTLFPCFDQPDLKAVFDLSLVIPAGWKAIANGMIRDSVTAGDSTVIHFRPSDRISTYLFAFAAGRFVEADRLIDGRPVRFLYRETDSGKLRLSLDSVFRIEGQALRFMAAYTGIDYPFQQFGFVAIPDFQFGGMEHPGAIDYQSRTLFLDSGATREQFIGRSNLLSHETAHMWFGDLVTMKWFNDVWMKEVFANYMANKISGVTMPDNDFDLKFLTGHYPAAYSVDRTAGTHPIRQQLDNLQEAGSLYGPIIYDKAPIVMRQLEGLIGPAGFRSGLRDYLKKYAGGNAEWDDLIFSLQPYTKLKVYEWSEVWVKGAGRPVFTDTMRTAGGKIVDLVIRQKGEDGSARVWPQVFEVALVYPGRVEELTVNMNAAEVHVAAAAGKVKPQWVVFNTSGIGYGVFPVDRASLRWRSRRSVTRAADYINLYENMLAGRVLTPRELLARNLEALASEREELNMGLLVDQIGSVFWHCFSRDDRQDVLAALEWRLWKLMDTVEAPNEKKLLFRAFSNLAFTRPFQDTLYRVWMDKRPPKGVRLSEDDYTGLAVTLALGDAPGYREILTEQLGRIQNKDRRDRLQYLMPSLSNDVAVRDSFFMTLGSAEARRKEAWVLAALANLHHPVRSAASEKYLSRSLEWLADIQRTGDVFFPQSWLQASFGNYQTATAAEVVRRFLREHPDYNPKLRAKILQAADNLFRAEKLIEIKKPG